MISSQVVSQLSHSDSKSVLSSFGGAVTDSSNALRKILNASLAAFGLVAITGLTTYAVVNYRRKRQNAENSNYLNDIEFEPNLSKSKRPREEIEEVI